MPLTEQKLELLPTTAALTRLIRNSQFVIRNSEGNCELKGEIGEMVAAANKLAQEKRFFHWALEFPEVFNPEPNNYELQTTNYELGFDCVLGNLPWERIKLQEKEFFASRSAEIANAANKAAREKLIKELPNKNPDLAQVFENAKQDAEAQSKFIRESRRFPLTDFGEINTYALFTELSIKLISSDGRTGIIVPTGIATDDNCKKLFGDLAQKQALASLYNFENRYRLFASVDSRMKFSLLAISGKLIEQGDFAFFLTQPRQIDNQARLFRLSPQDIALINPNTFTCPIFRTSVDAGLTKKIYQHVPILANEYIDSNPWDVSFNQGLFNMGHDNQLFKNQQGDDLLPLYEGKMFHQFGHRFATYIEGEDPRNLSVTEKCNTSFKLQAHYWVSRIDIINKLGKKWNR